MAKILVIDDEPGIRDIIGRVLEDSGHEVRSYENGRGAIEQVKSWAADLLITDIFMPEVEGLETIRRIRQIRPDLPIIAISGVDMAGSDYLGIAKKFGAVATLKKPFWPANLVDLVSRLLVLT